MIRSIHITDQMPPTIAQQLFTIGSGIAGGLAGMVMARGLVGRTSVPTSYVIGATAISALFTFGAAFLLIRTLPEE